MTTEQSLAQLQNNIEEYLRAADPALFGVTTIERVLCTPLEGGTRNITYLLRVNDKKFIARFYPKSNEGDPTADEFQKLRRARGLHAPQAIALLHPDFLPASLLIMEFVAGQHKDFNKLSRAEITNLARAIADLHTITREDTYSKNPDEPEDMQGNRLDYLQTIIESTILNRLRAAHPSVYAADKTLVDQALHELEKQVAQNKDAFTSSTFSYLHNDIVILNVLWNNDQPTLIDWESPSFGDPADEVAYIFAINNVSSEFQQIFLTEYEQRASEPTLRERIDIYMLKNKLFDVAWAISMLDEKRSNSNPLLEKNYDQYDGFYAVRLQALKDYL
jgi:aminoglycoside phosphotransferase (APT) family kinase protein